MSPTPQDKQQDPNTQDLPIVTEPIDPSSIVPAEAVEASRSEDQSDALSVYEASKLDAPVAPDLDSDEYKVTRHRNNSEPSENPGVSRSRIFAAAITGAAVLAGGAVAANVLPTDSDSVTTTDSNTEQQQEPTITVSSADQNVTPDQPNPENVQTTESVPSVSLNESTVADTVPTQVETSVESDGNPQTFVQENGSEQTEITQPEVSDSPSVLDDIERTAVGAEAYPGEITVGRAVDFIEYLINNQQKTGIEPIIEVSDAESGTLTFSDPNGYLFTVTGRMADGNIILDNTKRMSGIGAITIIDSKGNHLTVKSSKDERVKPGISVAKNGQNPITTNQELFPGAFLDETSAKNKGALISAEIDGYFIRNFHSQ